MLELIQDADGCPTIQHPFWRRDRVQCRDHPLIARSTAIHLDWTNPPAGGFGEEDKCTEADKRRHSQTAAQYACVHVPSITNAHDARDDRPTGELQDHDEYQQDLSDE